MQYGAASDVKPGELAATCEYLVMTILSLLQARVSSSRLPGKVLRPLLGKAMILRQIERLQRARLLGELMVVTSTEQSDDPLAELCRLNGIAFFRGSLNDVLDRFYQAAVTKKPDHIVRLTADCPLADPEVIDAVIQFHLDGGYDYSSNVLEPRFPDGLDIEVFRYRCLQEAWTEARLPSQREHVTPFINQQPERYKLGSYRNPQDWSHYRWTVDEPADFDMVERVYQTLLPDKPSFGTADVLQLLQQQPDIAAINRGGKRNAGYEKSLAADATEKNSAKK
jgi:spore coat polysaccharide biosynthesis protein SpsF